MGTLVFFLEEPSSREMLKGLLPRLLPETIGTQYVVFEGKQDLEKRLPKRLAAWQIPDCRFVVLRDQDSGNCVSIKQGLLQKCQDAGKTDALVRIACRELESWYLGDLQAVEQALKVNGLSSQQDKSKYRDPDSLGNPAEELAKLVPTYQKVSGSRVLGPHLDIENNRSTSFRFFVSGVRKLVDNWGNVA
ncbi:DUF4276 family protein [Candidatus Thiothrix sp. Deng01]|uniref:DUF4276 family protein n=1 Tax=Candidatus Thiothrix phosphatis TaxID=3112415 RepID=A0ABU6CY45_9GAMM|nr:DUF4276 family protein [Candidatus Thiothrix sp. Deng01]MEB4591695.1 DUF4276 family protein [Candidatus Thiothrix sp. Deng01]